MPQAKGHALERELPKGPPSWRQLRKQSLWLPQTTPVVAGWGSRQSRIPWSITGQRRQRTPRSPLRNIRLQGRATQL